MACGAEARHGGEYFHGGEEHRAANQAGAYNSYIGSQDNQVAWHLVDSVDPVEPGIVM
jgi:hypothetical protein